MISLPGKSNSGYAAKRKSSKRGAAKKEKAALGAFASLPHHDGLCSAKPKGFHPPPDILQLLHDRNMLRTTFFALSALYATAWGIVLFF